MRWRNGANRWTRNNFGGSGICSGTLKSSLWMVMNRKERKGWNFSYFYTIYTQLNLTYKTEPVLTLHSIQHDQIVCHFQHVYIHAFCLAVALTINSVWIAFGIETVLKMFDSSWEANWFLLFHIEQSNRQLNIVNFIWRFKLGKMSQMQELKYVKS